MRGAFPPPQGACLALPPMCSFRGEGKIDLRGRGNSCLLSNSLGRETLPINLSGNGRHRTTDTNGLLLLDGADVREGNPFKLFSRR